jgi:hypothetical protein
MGRYWLTALTLAAVAACGGDDGSTGVGSINVGGTWNISVSNMSGQGASCSTTSPVRATIRQTGSTFTGTYSGGIITCLTPTESFSSALGSGAVTNGEITGNTISFDLDSPDFHHDGTVSGNSMSGSAEWTYDFGLPLGVVTLTGSWSAVK